MQRERAIAILEQHQAEIQSLGVKSLALFGSVARDQAEPDSDVDLLVEFDENQCPKGFAFFEIEDYFVNLLGRSVDLVEPHLIKLRLQKRILNKSVPIFPIVNGKTRTYPLPIYGMTAKDWKIYIDDILDAMSKIQRYTQGISFEDFEANEEKVDAVIRNISIIGEAASKMLQEAKEVAQKYPQVPWEGMRNIWNRTIHDYRNISLAKIWIAVQDIPHQHQLLNQLLELEGE